MIKEIYINNFGKFNNFSLKFEEGINHVVGSNEAGKTTILAFIFMIMYGSNTRSQDLLQNDRLKYEPWDGSKMQGHIVCSKDGMDYKIERAFGKSNTSDKVRVFNLVNGEEIGIPNPKEPGEFFFGLGAEAFRKTMFISGEEMVISSETRKDEISQKLVNLVTTGEEDVSYKSAIENIDKKLFSYISKNGKNGQIIDLKNEINDTKLAIEEARFDENEKAALAKDINNKKSEIEKYKNKLENIETYRFLAENREELGIKKQHLDYELKMKEDFYLLDKADDIESQLADEESRNPLLELAMIDGLAILIFLGIFLISRNIFLAIALIILGLMALVYSANIKLKKKTARLEKIQDKKKELAAQIRESDVAKDEVFIEMQGIDRKIAAIDRQITEQGLDEYENEIYKQNDYNREIEELKLAIASLDAEAKERYRGKQNLSSLQIILSEKLDELAILENDYRLLQASRQVMEKAFGQVEVDFSSKLGDLASKLISDITNGKYEKLLVSNDFEIKVVESETKQIKDWKFLSAGTVDQFYLALRLSIIKLIVEDKQNRILLLDDIFMRFDQDRKNLTNETLKNLEPEFSQIISFVNRVDDIQAQSNIIYI